MTDPLHLSGRVEVGASLKMEFSDAQAYEDVVLGKGRPAVGSAHFECSFPPLADEDAAPVVLWGARAGDVQFGSPDDRWQELRRAGELKLVVPRVRYVDRLAEREPGSVAFRAVDDAWRAEVEGGRPRWWERR